MADVMSAFLKGHQAGQEEIAHNQAMDENKIRGMVLKHQLSGLKLEDTLRAREIAKTQADMMNGQGGQQDPTQTAPAPAEPANAAVDPRADVAPSGPAVDPRADGAPAPAATSLADGIRQRALAAITGAGQSAAAPAPRADRVWLPAINNPEMGVNVPGGYYSPSAAAEEQARRAVAAKLAEPYTLGQGQRRLVGGNEIARGSSKPIVLGPGRVAIDPDAPADAPPIATGPPAAPPRPLVVNGNVIDPVTHQIIAKIPPQVRPEDPGRAADRKARESFEDDFKEYSKAMTMAQQSHAEVAKAVNAKNALAMPDQQQEIPDFTPPSFSDWRATNKPAAAPAGAPAGKGGKPSPTQFMGKPVKAAKTYADGSFDVDPASAPVVSVKGQSIKITKVYKDGTFDGSPVK